MSEPLPFNASETAFQGLTDAQRVETAKLIQLFSDGLASSAASRSSLSTRSEFWSTLTQNWTDLTRSFRPGGERGTNEYLLALSRLTRNAVAGIPQNQAFAFECEPNVRDILFRLTAAAWLEDSSYYSHTRALAQLLSNLVTSNDALSSRLWQTYSSLPAERAIVPRLLASPDLRTKTATLVLLLNCTVGSLDRTKGLANRKILVPLLDWIDQVFDNEERTEEGRAFHLGYTIFKNTFSMGLFDDLYHSVMIASHTLSPAQLILLKLYDSFLHSADSSVTVHQTLILPRSMVPALLDLSFRIRRLRNDGNIEHSVGQGVVLVSDVITELVLQGDTSHDRMARKWVESARGDDDLGIPESMVELLRCLTTLSPPVPPLSVLPESEELAAVNYVKRSVVRLISTMSHRSKDVQDRVGMSGGLELILSLTTGDARNPYLREHALFAMRNLLEGNLQNQEHVRELELQGAMDEDGSIRNLTLRGSGHGGVNGR